MNDLRNEGCNVRFRIGLRTDVYHLVRTSDESTDKSEGYITWLSWDNHDILILMAKRVEKFFGSDFHEGNWQNKTQIQISQKLDKIIEMRFNGLGKWSNVPIHRVLLSLTRRRPRDLIKLLTSAAQEAYRKDSEIIKTEHLRSVCSHIGAIVLPSIVSVAEVHKIFDSEGKCLDLKIEKRLRGLGSALVQYIRQSICPRMVMEAMVRGKEDS